MAVTGGLGSGSVALDTIAAHMTGRPVAPWHAATLRWLTTYGPDDVQVTVMAAVAGALGVLLVALAVLPGRRGLWTVTSAPRLLAAVDRDVVESLVRASVAATAGIGTVRVRGSRRRITVRAGLRFGDPRVASAEAARGVLDACCLHSPPRLRVTVRPDALWDRRPAPPDSDDARTSAFPQGAES
ncbi:DUF6286 domain-containing protein [Streptomyces sp. NPDC006482]|uniref:DUF6286 domain-containing protein n=1 Tax=Streptomyces sp. NPDC006482 TaxID=3154306 RepID=UPI0033BE50F7